MRPEAIVDLDRYPVTDLAAAHSVVAAARDGLKQRGVAILPGFVQPDALAAMVRACEELLPTAHREDVAVGTPYLELPDEAYPEDHPRRTSVRSATWVLAYDLIPEATPIRVLYEWDPFMHFVGEVLDRRPLYRMDDPLGALNLAVMEQGDVQGWHYDSTDFVISLAIQASDGGGEFECTPRIRSADDENYDAVARVLAADFAVVEVFPFTPGTLMIFEGRHSLHRVSPIRGDVQRHVGLMGFDTKPGPDSSDLLKRVRYGRTEPIG